MYVLNKYSAQAKSSASSIFRRELFCFRTAICGNVVRHFYEWVITRNVIRSGLKANHKWVLHSLLQSNDEQLLQLHCLMLCLQYTECLLYTLNIVCFFWLFFFPWSCLPSINFQCFSSCFLALLIQVLVTVLSCSVNQSWFV